MDAPEKIPLDEAVARDLIPCSVCGAKGADVRQVEGKKHFLCAACAARGRRWTWALIVAGALLIGIAVYVRLSGRADPAGSSAGMIEEINREAQAQFLQNVDILMQQKRYADARKALEQPLAQMPRHPLLNAVLGRCLRQMGYYESSLAPWTFALQGKPPPEVEAEAHLSLGMAYQRIGHAAEGLPHLQKAYPQSPYEDERKRLLAECYLDLERFDEALKVAQDQPATDAVLRVRHLALLQQGKREEARKVYGFVGPDAPEAPRQQVWDRAVTLAVDAREDGDFAGALKILDEARSSVQVGSLDDLRLRRSALAVFVESGDLGRLESEATELAKSADPRLSGEALWYRAVGRLMAGKRAEAVADAKEFLGRVDRELGALRHEILMMEHLAGSRKESDFEIEAKALTRPRVNDLFFYLAISTGKPEWAKKASEATPGHNFPYHAIQRLLQK